MSPEETQNEEKKEETKETQKSIPGWVWGAGGILLLLFLLYQFFGGNLNGEEKPSEQTSGSPKQMEAGLPEPGEGESYFQFDLGMGTFNLILPSEVSPAMIDVAPDEGYNVDLGENRFLVVYFANESIEPGEDCGLYTDAVLGSYDYSSGYYRLNHESGAQACVLNSQVAGNQVFELGLFWGGSTYEFHSLSTGESDGAYVPRGYLNFEGEDNQMFIFEDGFESGDTSAWSR
jgi:hypothetical protein